MTFRQLEYLEAIALERSISRAAEKLFVSQSALSQQVIAMENEYQIQIFDRAKTPLELTADGQLYLHTAQELLRVKRQFEATVRHRRQHSLCIKTVPFYAANVVPYLLSKLHRELPQVEVQLKMDWAPNLFCTSYHEKVDLYVHAFDMDPYEPLIPPSDTMEQEVILEEEIVLALSALHPLLAGLSIGTDGEGWPSIDLADLAGAAFILPSTSVRLLDIAHLLCSGVAGEHTVRVSDKGFDALLGQLQYSNSVAFLPNTVIRFCPTAIGVRFFRIRGKAMRRPVVAAYPKGIELNTPARQFIRIARQAMAAPLEPPRIG